MIQRVRPGRILHRLIGSDPDIRHFWKGALRVLNHRGHREHRGDQRGSEGIGRISELSTGGRIGIRGRDTSGSPRERGFGVLRHVAAFDSPTPRRPTSEGPPTSLAQPALNPKR
jgi:hypothetical protein